jgi:predicted metal-binding protein
MSKETTGLATAEDVLRTYGAPWRGQLVLVCRKCQRKRKHEGKKNGLGKLNKVLRKRARKDDGVPPPHVVDVSCLKLCPKSGVTVCTERQLGRRQCSIVRTSADVDALLDLCKEQDGDEKSCA